MIAWLLVVTLMIGLVLSPLQAGTLEVLPSNGGHQVGTATSLSLEL